MNKMLSVFTTADYVPAVQEIIDSEFRLNELVDVLDLLEHKPGFSADHLIARPKQGIAQPIDWFNTQPPYLLPEGISFSREHLLALIYTRLDNWERVSDLLTNEPALLHELRMFGRLQAGEVLDPGSLHSDFQPFEEYRFCHNSAILHHYASDEAHFNARKTQYFYQEALKSAPSDEYAAFSSKHLAALLLDTGQLAEAEQVLQQTVPLDLSGEARTELKATLVQVWLKKLTVPYDPTLLANLKKALWEVLEAYQHQGRQVEEALVLMDAAQVANYSESFAESLGYINRAVAIFQAAELPELLAQAHHRRAMLLYTWAKSGNPQFLPGALQSFKEAVKVFDRESAPAVFADIQQYLGIIYAEMPDETLKRSMWAAVSAAAFQESLAFFRKDLYPYEYAMVSNHYGNALTKYPAAVHSDNIEKALFYYQESLSVRTAKAFPFERAVTLLNYVEACWYLNLENGVSSAQLFGDMQAKANEALALTSDPNVQDEAQQHLQRLAKLQQTLDQETAEATL